MWGRLGCSGVMGEGRKGGKHRKGVGWERMEKERKEREKGKEGRKRRKERGKDKE